MTQGQIIATIEALQDSMDYADEAESLCLAAEIERQLLLLAQQFLESRTGE